MRWFYSKVLSKRYFPNGVTMSTRKTFMKKIVIFAALSLIIALIYSATAMAYDHLITNDTSAVQEAGTMKAEAQLLYWTADEGFDQDAETYDLGDDSSNKMAIPVKFRYGVMDNLEAFGVLGLFENWDFGELGESGVGDLWLGVKYTVMPEGLLTVRGALDIPLGDDEKGLGYEGGFGIDIAAMTATQMDAIGMNAQAGLRWSAEDGDTKLQPGIGFYLDGEGSYALSDVLKAQAGLEFMIIGDRKLDGESQDKSTKNWIELNLGATYSLTENMGIKGDFLYNLAGKNTEKNMGILIGFMYGF